LCGASALLHLSLAQNCRPQSRQNSALLHRGLETIDAALALADDGAGVLEILSGGALPFRLLAVEFLREITTAVSATRMV
jgi:hypothetical protein